MSAQLTPLLIIGGAFLYYSQQDSDTESSGSGESGDNLDDFMCIGISEASTCQDINDEDISQEEKRTKCLESDGQECAWVDRYMDDGGPNLRRLQCQTHIQDLVKETEEKGNRAVQKAMEEWKDDKTSIEACADIDQTTVEGIFALQAQKQICEDFVETDDYKNMTVDQRNKNVCYEHFPEYGDECAEYATYPYTEWMGLTEAERSAHVCKTEMDAHCREYQIANAASIGVSHSLDNIQESQPCYAYKPKPEDVFFRIYDKSSATEMTKEDVDSKCQLDESFNPPREMYADWSGKYSNGKKYTCYTSRISYETTRLLETYKTELSKDTPETDMSWVDQQKAELYRNKCFDPARSGDLDCAVLHAARTSADVKPNMYAKYDITKGFLEFEEDCPYSHYYDRAGTFGIRNHCYPPKM